MLQLLFLLLSLTLPVGGDSQPISTAPASTQEAPTPEPSIGAGDWLDED